MGTIDVAALLEAGEAGGEDGELGTGEPVSLLLSPPVGTIDVDVLLYKLPVCSTGEESSLEEEEGSGDSDVALGRQSTTEISTFH